MAIFLFSTAPPTSTFTFVTEEISVPCASAQVVLCESFFFIKIKFHSLSWSLGILCEIFLGECARQPNDPLMESIKSAFDYRFIRNLQTMDCYAVEGFAGYLKGGRTMSLYKGPK